MISILNWTSYKAKKKKEQKKQKIKEKKRKTLVTTKKYADLYCYTKKDLKRHLNKTINLVEIIKR